MAGKWMVERSRKMTPKKEAVRLYPRSEQEGEDYAAPVSYPYARVKPMDESFQGDGLSAERASITLWQEGSPSTTPYSGCMIIDASDRAWLVEFVRSKHQWGDSYGIFNCDCVRVPMPDD